LTAAMRPRERVSATLDFREPDRVPFDLGQAAGDGITTTAYHNLLQYLGFPQRPIRIESKLAQTALVDEDVLRRFHIDFRRLDLGAPDNWTDRPTGDDGYIDEWGVIRSRPKGGYYYDLTGSPFAEKDTLADIDRYTWPDPFDAGRFRGLADRARKLHQDTDFAVVLQVNCAFFLRCAELRSWENFYADLAGNQLFASALMERYLDIRLAIAGRALAEVGDNVDVVFVSSDDLGMVDRTIVSPKTYRNLIKPLQKKTFDFFKARTPAKRFYHCDGAIYSLLGDFVDIGVDALNPIEVSAAGMGDTQKLKQEYGDRLAFWGGIDTRHVLPHGSVAEVRAEVRRRIRDLAPGGGYVLCSVHNIQPEVPPENVVAMFDEAYQIGHYPIGS